MESTLKFQRGDIYFVRLDNRTGSEQSGTRPAVILQNDVGNSCSPTLIVATLTSKTEKKAMQPTHCLVEPEGLEPSIVQAEQIFTIDKSRVKRFLINGNVEKECPELRIIEPEVFEKAQELRDARRREKGEDADSYSPHALLCGKVFCAHCGNRLNITSSGRTRLRADGTVVKEKRYRYSCNFNVRHPGQCDGQSGYGVTTLDAVVESIVCMKFEEILECSKSNLLEEMRRKDLDAAKKETTRWKEEVQTKVDEQDALKKEMIRVIQGTSGLDREMIQQMVNENKEALLTAQTNLEDSEKKLKEIEEQNQKAERNCSDLFTWASTYKGASFERRQAILKQFIKEVRVGRDYNIEIVLNVPLDEFEEFKRHAASAGRGKNQKNKSQNPQKVGRCTSNAGIVVLDKTAGETISIVPKNAARAILRC